MTIRIVLADDHVVLRQGLRMLIDDEPDLEVIAEADNGQEAVDLTLQHRPDLVLMDLVMPDMDGITATGMLHRLYPEVRVVILSSLEDDAAVVSAVRAGAIGYVRKTVPIEVLVRAIRAAAQGQVQLSAAATARLVKEISEPMAPERLTARELEVLECIAQGLANKAIAWKLRISEKTVKSHVSTLLSKFGLESRTQVAVRATTLGLVSADQLSTVRQPVGPAYAAKAFVPGLLADCATQATTSAGGTGRPRW